MAYTIRIVESNSAIESLIMKEIINRLNKRAEKAIPRMKEQLSSLLRRELKKTNFYKECVHGTLRAEFGFIAGHERVIIDGIIDIIADEVQIDFTPFVNTRGIAISGGYTIYMIDSQFRNALDSSLAVTMNKGEKLPWLEWVLKEGDKIIIAGYKIVMGNFPGDKSRSKEAIMVKGGIRPFWRVPPQFSGVENANWITKAFKGSNLSNDFVFGDIQIAIEHIVYSNLDRLL